MIARVIFGVLLLVGTIALADAIGGGGGYNGIVEMVHNGSAFEQTGDISAGASTTDFRLRLNGQLILDDDGDDNDYITCTANDSCRWVVGNAAQLTYSTTTFTIGLASVFGSNVRTAGVFYQDSVPTITLAAAATTFAATRNKNKVDCDGGGNTIATITGDQAGMGLCLTFVDASCTITDDATAAADTVNLSAAFTSTANDILCLDHDGTSWREASRSLN